MKGWFLPPPYLVMSLHHLSKGSFSSPNQQLRCQPTRLEDIPTLYTLFPPGPAPSTCLGVTLHPHEERKGDTAAFHTVLLLKKPFHSLTVLI